MGEGAGGRGGGRKRRLGGDTSKRERWRGREGVGAETESTWSEIEEVR